MIQSNRVVTDEMTVERKTEENPVLLCAWNSAELALTFSSAKDGRKPQ